MPQRATAGAAPSLQPPRRARRPSAADGARAAGALGRSRSPICARGCSPAPAVGVAAARRRAAGGAAGQALRRPPAARRRRGAGVSRAADRALASTRPRAPVAALDEAALAAHRPHHRAAGARGAGQPPYLARAPWRHELERAAPRPARAPARRPSTSKHGERAGRHAVPRRRDSGPAPGAAAARRARAGRDCGRPRRTLARASGTWRSRLSEGFARRDRVRPRTRPRAGR